MAHFHSSQLTRPTSFNFASDVVDYWASHPPPGDVAMHWISQDRSQERKLSFKHFSRQSHRLAVLFREKLGVNKGERMLIIMPRLPEW
jgi:acyl-coenzyme A synthetase/AMP-(fatty) acid ligase